MYFIDNIIVRVRLGLIYLDDDFLTAIQKKSQLPSWYLHLRPCVLYYIWNKYLHLSQQYHKIEPRIEIVLSRGVWA